MNNNTMIMDTSKLFGQKYTVKSDPNTEFTCVGFGQNQTFVVFGAVFDSTNNRTQIQSHKIGDVEFKGQVA